MALKFDRFTWGVLGVVALLLIAAVITANLRSSPTQDSPLSYLDEDSPQAVVYNAYVALRFGDATKVEELYSAAVLADEEMRWMRNQMVSRSDQQQRMRILRVEELAADRALVTIAIDYYYQSGGLFNSGSSNTNRRDVSVIRENGRWVIDTILYF
jgi:hypothetical protein